MLPMYYLWLNEAQAGPYTLQQVQSMWNAGQITALTLYWQKGNAEWQPLGDIISKIESAPPAEITSKTAVIPDLQQTDIYKANKQTAFAVAHTSDSAEPRPEENLWMGHPTLWKWAYLLVLSFILVAVLVGTSIFLNFIPGIALAPLFLAPFVLYIYFIRNSTRYTITNKRVSLETGIFNKTSRELRIQDVRSINAKINFLGYGNIEFSSAARDDADVIFNDVPNATVVRDLVKKLQP